MGKIRYIPTAATALIGTGRSAPSEHEALFSWSPVFETLMRSPVVVEPVAISYEWGESGDRSGW